MSAFGRKNGLGGMRPAFGVAKPMHVVTPKSGGSSPSAAPSSVPNEARGGDQFPALDPSVLPLIDAGELAQEPLSPQQQKNAEAMSRLHERMNTDHSAHGDAEGFDASVHKIKEQVLPRLLERVDPEAAATLTKDELAEEFRPIIMEVLAELKLTLNRREQFALEKVLVDELLGLGPLEELLNDPDISDIMVNGPNQTYIEKKGKLQLAPIRFRDEEHLFQIAQRIVNKVGRRVDPPARRQPRQRDCAAALPARHRHLHS